jgi:D-aminopeptidase
MRSRVFSAQLVRYSQCGFLLLLVFSTTAMAQPRPRARDLGLVVGIFSPGTHNAITDVDGVKVGQVTIHDGDSIHTGVTAILPHAGNQFLDRVPAALFVGNGYGKLTGVTQLRELGELETPILLTCTLCVWRAADAMAQWMMARPGMEDVRSINPVVGETNDGTLNDIRKAAVTSPHVVRALETAASGLVEEGSVGAGSGTVAFGWKGGIGTSSRKLSATLGGYTVGVLVQSNYGGVLAMNGAPVGRELGRYSFQDELGDSASRYRDSGDGSIMIVVATDAPLDSRNLERLASRAIVGVGRTGSSMSNGSGDYVLAFSTASTVRRGRERVRPIQDLGNNDMSPLFQAVIEATEEAIYNSMLRATTVRGHRGTVEALPIDRVTAILRKYQVLNWKIPMSRQERE